MATRTRKRTMKVEGSDVHTPQEGKVGGGPSVANRNGIFRVEYSKASSGGKQLDTWIVQVKNKPGQWNVAVGITTTGPSEEDKGFARSDWKLISGKFSDQSKRPGQSRLGTIHDLLLSVGVKPAAVKKAVPLKGEADLDRLEKILDKYLDGKEGYAQLLDEKKSAYKGEIRWQSKVLGYIPKETAEGLIATSSHESPLSVGAKDYKDNGPTKAEDDENFDDDGGADTAAEDAAADDLDDTDDDLPDDDDDDDFDDDDEDLD